MTIDEALSLYMQRVHGPKAYQTEKMIRDYLLQGGTNDSQQFTAYVRGLTEHYADSTVDLNVRTIRAFYRFHGKRPPDAIGWSYNIENANRPAFTTEYIQDLIWAMRRPIAPPRFRQMVMLSTLYGLRVVEMSRVSASSFRDQFRSLHILTAKKGHPRWIYVPESVRPYFRIGPWPRTTTGTLHLYFKKVADFAGLPAPARYSWHSIRRSLARDLAAERIPDIDVIRFIRWRSEELTPGKRMMNLYAHPTEQTDSSGKRITIMADPGTREADEVVWDHHPYLPWWEIPWTPKRPDTIPAGFVYNAHDHGGISPSL